MFLRQLITINHWASAGAGKGGIAFTYVITNRYASVEIYFDRGKDSTKLNKERFDKLYKYKEETEKKFGDSLLWERLDTKRASRVSYRIGGVGILDKDKWGEIQDAMINAMMRLEKVFKPLIRDLE